MIATSKTYIICRKNARDSSKNGICTCELDNDRWTHRCESLAQAAEKEKLNWNVGSLPIPSMSPQPQCFSTMNLFKQWHGFFLLWTVSTKLCSEVHLWQINQYFFDREKQNLNWLAYSCWKEETKTRGGILKVVLLMAQTGASHIVVKKGLKGPSQLKTNVMLRKES